MSERIEGLTGRSAMTQGERDLLLSLIPETGNVLEIGTLDGATCGWLASQRPKVGFVSVDPFLPAFGTGPGDPEVWEKNAKKNQGLYIGVLATYRPIVEKTERRFDLIIIDGCHAHWSALSDLHNARVILAEGGAIAAHDCYVKVADRLRVGVIQAVAEFVSCTAFREVADCDSLSVLKNVGKGAGVI